MRLTLEPDDSVGDLLAETLRLRDRSELRPLTRAEGAVDAAEPRVNGGKQRPRVEPLRAVRDALDSAAVPPGRASAPQRRLGLTEARSKRAPAMPSAPKAARSSDDHGGAGTARSTSAPAARSRRGSCAPSADAPEPGRGLVLRTLAEPAFASHGSQIRPDALRMLEALPAASEEANARRPAAPITTTVDARAPSAAESFVIPADLRATSAAQLGLRVHRSAEARASHEVRSASLGDERVALVALIQAASEDEALWAKKAMGGANNPVVAMLHNCLVRIRRYHRLLEDTALAVVGDEAIDGIVRMLDFCTVVITESGRSALYNQAVKHMGEFFCYKYISPPVLRLGAAGAIAVLRDALLSLFGLLARGSQLNDASRAAVREALRCAACSDAPAPLLLEAAIEPMLRFSKQRDDFAVRTREMGLTIVLLALRRHGWGAARSYLDGACRTTGLRSKLHALVGVLAAARADAAKSALNKALAAETVGALGALVGERLAGVVRMSELDLDAADELVRLAGLGPDADEVASGAHTGSRVSSSPHKLRRRSLSRGGSSPTVRVDEPTASPRLVAAPSATRRAARRGASGRALQSAEEGAGTSVSSCQRSSTSADEPEASCSSAVGSSARAPSSRLSGRRSASGSARAHAFLRRATSSSDVTGSVPGGTMGAVARASLVTLLEPMFCDGGVDASCADTRNVAAGASGARAGDACGDVGAGGAAVNLDLLVDGSGLRAARAITQIRPDALRMLEALPAASEEANARRPAAPITTTVDARAPSAAESFVIPADLRATSAAQLGLRVHRSAEARASHEVRSASLGDERVALVALIQAASEDEALWAKKAMGGANNPVVAMLHNCLVRIRRYHRLLEDTAPAIVGDEAIDGIVRMLDFCTVVITESGRSALYNQAVKHIGEFFCYKYISPPVLRLAGPERRVGRGAAIAVLRDALLSLFGLLARGSQLNDASRAAVREALRCAACSDAPAPLLLEAAIEPMLRFGKQRDDYAVRTREMGLTIVLLALRRHGWGAARSYLDGACRTTGLRSKLHALVGVLAAARADAAKSALNKALAAETVGALGALVGERLAGVVRMSELDLDAADELLVAGGIIPAASLASSARSSISGRRSASAGGGSFRRRAKSALAATGGGRASSAPRASGGPSAFALEVRAAVAAVNEEEENVRHATASGVAARSPASSSTNGSARVAAGAELGAPADGAPHTPTPPAPISRVISTINSGYFVEGAPGGTGHRLDLSALKLLEKLPSSADEEGGPFLGRMIMMAAAERGERCAVARSPSSGGGGAAAHTPPPVGSRRGSLAGPSHLRRADSGSLTLVRPFDGSVVSAEVAPDLDDEIARVLMLVEHCSAAWLPQPDGAPSTATLDPALVHNCLVRIRRCHRLCDDERSEPSPLRLHAFAAMLTFILRLLSQNTALALQQHALTHVAEHFCYKFATRRLLDPPPASLGQPHRALHAGVLRALFRLLAVSDHFVARSLRAEAREAVRCAACSALQPELLLEVAIEALARTLPGAAAPRRARASATSPPDSASDSRSADADEEVRPSDTSVALVEMGLLVVYLVLARHRWESLAHVLSQRAAESGRERLSELLRALALSSAHGGASALVAALRSKLMGELSRALGEARFDALLAGDLGLGAERIGALASMLPRRSSFGGAAGLGAAGLGAAGLGAACAASGGRTESRGRAGATVRRGVITAEKLAAVTQARANSPAKRGAAGTLRSGGGSAPAGNPAGAGGRPAGRATSPAPFGAAPNGALRRTGSTGERGPVRAGSAPGRGARLPSGSALLAGWR